jgi:hypothetical protein
MTPPADGRHRRHRQRDARDVGAGRVLMAADRQAQGLAVLLAARLSSVDTDYNFMSPDCDEDTYYICWPTIGPSSLDIYEAPR